MKRDHHARAGFTLIELLLGMGLLTILLGVLTDLLLVTIDVQLRTTATSQIEHDARFLAQRLVYDIRRATAITDPTGNGQTTSSLTLSIEGSSYTVSVADGDLQLASPLGTDRLTSVGTTVSDFSVTRIGNMNGGDTLRLTYTLRHGAESRTYQVAGGLR